MAEFTHECIHQEYFVRDVFKFHFFLNLKTKGFILVTI